MQTETTAFGQGLDYAVRFVPARFVPLLGVSLNRQWMRAGGYATSYYDSPDLLLPMAVSPEKTSDSASVSDRQPDAKSSDDILVTLAKQGDKLAFRILVDRHQNSLARKIVGMIGDRGSVDDVLQDVFIQFHNSLDKFRGDAAVKTYLNRIAVNKSLDLLRRRKRWHKRFLSRDEAAIVEVDVEVDHSEQSDRKRLIWKAIESLPDAQRSVMVLRMIDGYSTEETSEILSIEYGTVLSRLSRGMTRLRGKLGPLFESEVSQDQNHNE